MHLRPGHLATRIIMTIGARVLTAKGCIDAKVCQGSIENGL